MARTVLLNKEQHLDLCVNTGYSAALGDAVMWVPTFALEFRNLQAHYPILFHKDTNSGRFFPVALLGLEQGENLFLTGQGWDCRYIPLMQQRIPFSIGLYNEGDSDVKRPMINIDLEHPKVSSGTGRRLFETHGGVTPYLEKMSNMLNVIHDWNTHNEQFIKALVELELLEPVNIDITLTNGDKGQLFGYFTIKEERLAELSAAELHSLNQQNFLLPIYMALASVVNIRELIERKSATASRSEQP